MPNAWRLAAVTLAIGLTSWGGIALTREAGNVSAIWLADGVLLGILLTVRPERWPAYLLAAYVANCAANRIYGDITALALALPLCNAIGTLIAARALCAYLNDASDLSRRRAFGYFMFYGVGRAPAISASLGATVLYAMAHAAWGTVFGTWYLAVALGTAIATPLMLSIRRREVFALFRAPLLARTLGLLALMMGATVAVFAQSRYPLLFLLCPILMVVVAQLGFAGAAVSVCAVGVIAMLLTIEGTGPAMLITGITPAQQIEFVQLFIAAMVVMALPVAVTLAEREHLRGELERANTVLHSQAMTDGLTGLANRRYFDDMLEREWRRAARSASVMSLLLVDIDYFKLYNDYYGHPAGDLCLKTVAGALTGSAGRSVDICARYGGEEFAVILPDTPSEGARAIAEELRQAVEKLGIEHVKAPSGRLTFSIGIASMIGSYEENPGVLIERADRALYAAKSGGRNRVVADGSPPPRLAG